jgi:membrane fusion protein, adhesin transport system
MRQSDLAFLNDVRAASELRTPRTSRVLLASVVALMATGLTWAHFAELDEVKRGNGRVVPSQQIQVLQSLEGGIVREILVHEGAIVKQGQILMKIDDTRFAAELGEVRERRAANGARVARLEAEVQGRSKPEFADELVKIAPQAVDTERNVFDARQKKLEKDIDVLAQQQTRLAESLKLLNRQVELTRDLYVKKIVPEIEMLQLDQKATEMKGQLAEVQSRIDNIKAAFRSQAEEDLAKSRGDLAVFDQTIKTAQDRVRRAELRSPVNGIVNRLNVNTVGAVIQPGGNMKLIVPGFVVVGNDDCPACVPGGSPLRGPSPASNTVVAGPPGDGILIPGVEPTAASTGALKLRWDAPSESTATLPRLLCPSCASSADGTKPLDKRSTETSWKAAELARNLSASDDRPSVTAGISSAAAEIVGFVL